uniref:Uncharacterized protein n=1 Tax=Neobodo designis TaxID=312471 RepID=A0A7S1LWZ0_NEODS|mmetsp:Transcript_30065/g.92749  ORF Transcript_30065/g.92749 Transcript_30065/m.92749 type:complete len:184 (+) Transcript_30065:95-646(+)|eukprot:CAMPEP_0174831990 /NCGR_PEP_ID=MMETSP1114-20130205/3417_1 /TAXON_ID=312471 /ORGANISM="Neobodo designis, Strain CCAP 1951/1" /LENGTH=183 /DNA_ID=CAMNT_0016065839 /DNA_START=94 /DNA_END=645 /DNA_ORIENTATION=+
MLKQMAAAAGGSVFAFATVFAYQWNTAESNPPPSPPIPEGKTRICVAGYSFSPPTGHAHELAARLADEFPDRFETWYYFSMFEYWPFAKERFEHVNFPPALKGHSTSPFVWFEHGPNYEVTPIGGDDRFTTWVAQQEEFMVNNNISWAATSKPSLWTYGYHTGSNAPEATCYGPISYRKGGNL